MNIGQLDLIAKAKINSPKKIEDFDFFIEKYIDNDLIMQKIDLNSEKIYPIGDIWNDIYSFTQSEMRVSENISFYSSQKPKNMLRRIIQASSNKGNLVCDFLCGSGTTLSVAHKLKRKYLGIEIGEHFHEKYLTYNKETKKNKNNNQFMPLKYYEIKRDESIKHSYILDSSENKSYSVKDYDEDKIIYNGIIDYRKSRKLIKKLNKAEDKPITINMSAEYREEFDIFQTIANLMNLKIKRLFLDKNGIENCEYDNGEILNNEKIDLYRYPKLKSLIWWKEI